MIDTEQKLIEMGLRVWEKHGRRRIYINPRDFGRVFGLELKFDTKTGEIVSATLHGKPVSPKTARKLLGRRTPYYSCKPRLWRGNLLKPIIFRKPKRSS